MKTEGTKSPPLVVAKLAASNLPMRSAPLEYFEQFAEIVAKLGEGQAVELDSNRIDEHRGKKYLDLLASKDPSYARLRLRTAGGGDRRRVFLVNTRPADIQLGTSQDPRP